MFRLSAAVHWRAQSGQAVWACAAGSPLRSFSVKNTPKIKNPLFGQTGPKRLSLDSPYFIAKQRVFKVKNPLKRLPRARELAGKDREKLQRELEREEETEDKDWSKFLR